MKWVSCISEREASIDALAEVVDGVKSGLDGAPPDVLFLFASGHHMEAFADLPYDLQKALDGKALIGCSGGGVIGGGQEVENGPALAVMAAVLPSVRAEVTHLFASKLPSVEEHERWFELLGVTPEDAPQFVVLADPIHAGGGRWLSSLDAAFPAATKVGGLVSGSSLPEGLALFANGAAEHQGVTLLTLSGDVIIDPILAQGCKPIGEVMLVSSCEGNAIYGINQKKPVEVLRELHAKLSPEDQNLFRSSLFVGLQMKDQVEYTAGDFLIRNILGLDEESLMVGAAVDRWQALQFHLRDRHKSAEDLASQLERYQATEHSTRPAAALLFSCMGRGEHLYRHRNHDSDMFRDKIANVPIGGFFCNGEIGPVGGTTYTHGYTSAFGVVRPRAARSANTSR